MLIALWSGNFKGIDKGSGCYHLAPSVWEAIGEATALSGDTILSAFCSRPVNIAKDSSGHTAEVSSFWAQYIGPVLLRRQFQHDRYYNHFVKLVKLINTCLKFEYTSDDVASIEHGFAEWVEQYKL
jgi:hypothetical protein